MRTQFTVDGFTVVVRSDGRDSVDPVKLLVAIRKGNIKRRILDKLYLSADVAFVWSDKEQTTTTTLPTGKWSWLALPVFDGPFQLWPIAEGKQYDSQQEAFNSLVEFVRTSLSREIPSSGNT